MVAGTAASVGLALANDRRLTPVFVEAAPQSTSATAVAMPPAGPLFALREFIARRVMIAAALAAAVVILAASIPAVTAVASTLRSSSPSYGPPAELRAAAGVAGNWEQSNAIAAPPADQLGNAVVAGAVDRYYQELADALVALARVRDRQGAVAGASVRPPAASYTMGTASGFGAGTVLHARITIYGCTGPGGGFCHRMSSGGAPFAGAVACSDNLPFGTKLKIQGDPTGRIYECLDRGRLSPTWVDVYFDDTSAGMAWQSSLGTTLTDIEIVN